MAFDLVSSNPTPSRTRAISVYVCEWWAGARSVARAFQPIGQLSKSAMPSKKQYNLVQNDDYDTRIPLHSDEAFHHGITFQAKVTQSSSILVYL